MTDSEVMDLCGGLRTISRSERAKGSDLTVDIFFVNMLDIVASITELGVRNNRPVSEEEEYWFQGYYHMNFWDAETENRFYSPLVAEVVRRNYFR
jgi:hypothetical protein